MPPPPKITASYSEHDQQSAWRKENPSLPESLRQNNVWTPQIVSKLLSLARPRAKLLVCLFSNPYAN